jgi:hypothetical protein
MKNTNRYIFPPVIIPVIFLFITSIGLAQERHVYACPDQTTFQYIDEVYRADKSDGVCQSGTYFHESPEITSGSGLANSVAVTRLDGGPHRAQVDISWKDHSEGTIVIRITYKKDIFYRLRCQWSERFLYTLYVHRQYVAPTGTFSNDQAKSAVSDTTPITFNLSFTPAQTPSGFLLMKARYSNIAKPSSGPVDPATMVEATIPIVNGHYGSVPIEVTAIGFGSHTLSIEVLTYIDNCEKWIEIFPVKQVEIISSCYKADFSDVSISVSPVLPENSFLGEDPPAFAVNVGQTYNLVVTGITDFDSNYQWNLSDWGSNVSGNASGFSPINKGSYRVAVEALVPGCPVPSGVMLLAGIGPGDHLTIDQTCTIVLPMDISSQYRQLETDDVIFRHFKAVVSTDRSNIVNPGVTLELGAELILDDPEPAPDESNEVDLDKNYIQASTFDEYGRVLASGRSYFDDNGALQQAQSKSLSSGVILANATVYDMYNRSAIQSLPAPVIAALTGDAECPNDSQIGADVRFEYKPNFITVGTDVPYTYADFDLAGNENDPAPIDHSQEGTLGWYYSANNVASSNPKVREPLVAQTQYPFSRTVFQKDGTGDVKGVTRPGDEFKPGSGYMAEAQKNSIAIDDPYLTDATKGYLAIRHKELQFPDPPSIEAQFFKTTVTDEMGRKSVMYTDKAGNTVISVFLGTGASSLETSYRYYDNAGRLILTISPKGLEDYSGNNFSVIDKT